MDKELFGWVHTKNCGQQLIVHMHTSGEWCPLGVSTEPTLFDIFVVNMDSGKANGTLGYMAAGQEVILPFYSALVIPSTGCCIQFWCP